MTPQRAKELAEEHGCEADAWNNTAFLRVARAPDNYILISPSILAELTEPDFIAFYIPDGRD